jgi:hypothetical protein
MKPTIDTSATIYRRAMRGKWNTVRDTTGILSSVTALRAVSSLFAEQILPAALFGRLLRPFCLDSRADLGSARVCKNTTPIEHG